ncbi:MAG: hypothetical protein J1F67_11125 [Muribaculaceae bacterium]|nr:hypothetical protein [Muribaculaceae bacterium]
MHQSESFATSQQERWFLLNYISKSHSRKDASVEECVRRFNTRENLNLEVFAPSFVAFKEKEGKQKPVTSPLLFHYAFVKGTFPQIKKLCGESNDFSFVLNNSSDNRYAYLDDIDMMSFKMIARKYSNQVPFYSLEGLNLQDCDKVEVVEGDFPGLIGYFHPYKGGKKGRVVLKLSQDMATFAYDINVKYLRVLEFSKNYSRAYEIIDNFIPKLYNAMRKFTSGETLDEKETTELHSFCRRMGRWQPRNNKIEAKLNAILAMANHILGNEEEEILAKEKLEKTLKAVTSPVVKAFISLLEYVATKDRSVFQQGLESLSGIKEKSSKSLSQLIAEYEYYK